MKKRTMSPSSFPPAKAVTGTGKWTVPWGATFSGPGGRSSPSAWCAVGSCCGVRCEERWTLMHSWRDSCMSTYLDSCQMKRRRRRKSKISQVNVWDFK
ncbi:hypothetical protein LDENG_00259090 [Lucifuga dentata]|nr:hypothetical protein LDENG_00259090 [Lucifuga dentata]